MDNIRPTKKQKELLNFIDGFIKGYGYGPSYREIMRALDYKSVSTVATHVDGLIMRGWLVKKDNSARSLVVIMPEQSAPTVQSITATERVIKKKLDELKEDGETNAHAISVLTETLEILGFKDTESKEIV